MSSLDALFRPRSVAIVGASADPNKVGGRPLAFLKKAGYAGRLLPVNPGADEVQGVPAFRSLADIDGPIDQAIVALPAAAVPAAVQQCIERGVKALQLFSAGFGDGPQAAALLARARAAGMRVLGPNSLGLFNTADGFFGTFATALDGAWPRGGGVGVATQSGAFGSYFFGMAQQRGMGFSHFVATGNESDVTVADCVAWMAEDAATRLIVMAIEGCRDGRRLVDALRLARARGKPVLAMKVGVSQAGARAAATHTGSLSGQDRVIDGVFRDAGAWRAGSLQELVDAASVATAGPLPANRELLVVTTSGGIGVLCADAAEADGLELPPVAEDTLGAIRGLAPLADGRNPVDTSAGILGDVSVYAAIAGRALADRSWGAALLYLAHLARNPSHWAAVREPLFALRSRHPAVAFAAVLLADDGIADELRERGFAVFVDPCHAVRALAACAKGRTPPSTPPTAAPRVPRLDGPLDTEDRAKRALAAAGLRFAPERLVHDEASAVAAAGQLGYPVVLKVVSPDIAHKTEAGGVRLGLRDEAALRAAMGEMRAEVAARRPDARIDGFLVCRQLGGGVEVLVGTACDPAFGPVVTVGAGGVAAELLDDVQVRLAPVSAQEALAMLRATRVAGRLCEGYRGSAPADVGSLAAQIERLSHLAWQERDRIASIDLNPVLVRADGAWALDALIVEHAATGADAGT